LQSTNKIPFPSPQKIQDQQHNVRGGGGGSS